GHRSRPGPCHAAALRAGVLRAAPTRRSPDLERAPEIARNMVPRWGLSDRLGPLTYSEESGEVFLGRSVTQHKQVSDVTAHAIDEDRKSTRLNYSHVKSS